MMPQGGRYIIAWAKRRGSSQGLLKGRYGKEEADALAAIRNREDGTCQYWVTEMPVDVKAGERRM